MLSAVLVHLQPELFARLHAEPLDLETLPCIDDLVIAPRAENLRMAQVLVRSVNLRCSTTFFTCCD
jgi:hypothetical protein